MKAIRFLGNSQVEIAELPNPAPNADQVLIEVKASGLCGSELGAYRGPNAMDSNAGHEVAGIVADPNGHPQWEVGDRVGVFTLQGCGKCRWCRAGKDTFCDEVGVPSATHSQYSASRAHSMVKLDDDISFPIAVLLCGDGIGVPYGSALKAGVKAGDITCVFGCGPVGLGMVLLQSFLGAHVIAVDVNPTRLGFAEKMGAWQTVNSAETADLVATLRDMTDGAGPDKCFEAAGRQDTLDVAMKATVPEGVICCVGHGPQQINPQDLIAKRNLTIMGNWIAHPGYYCDILAMYRAGLPLEKLITATMPYTEASEAYKRAAEGTEAKIVFEW
jgi:threonine dehydrogenase-like Zn-dependent dehydrogenase